MQANYHKQKPLKLHSPLLDGKLQKIQTIDETLDKTLFNKQSKKEALIIPLKNKLIDEKKISSLETIVKIACTIMVSTGSIFSLLEVVTIVQAIQRGSYEIVNDLALFTTSLIGTLLAYTICSGFIHLIKTTRHLYNNVEEQNKKIEQLISCINPR